MHAHHAELDLCPIRPVLCTWVFSGHCTIENGYDNTCELPSDPYTHLVQARVDKYYRVFPLSKEA